MQRRLSALAILSVLVALPAAELWAQAPAATTESSRLLQDIQRYESSLADLESDFGPFDPRLLEPLSGIEALYEQLGDFEQVLTIQSRRLQLVRTSLGIEHPDSIPVVEEIIGTEIQLGNWEAVSDHLDHLQTLARENFAGDSDQVMLAMERQASWYLARVYLDRRQDRAENFMEAREIYDDLLDLAEDRYGEEDPALIPWLYKRALSLAQLVALLNSEGSLRGDAIDETIRADGAGRLQTANRQGWFSSTAIVGPSSRVPVVNGQEPIGAPYLRQASGFIDDIRDIAEAEEDWETWAMATLYYGDYSFLQGRNTGRGYYRDAIEKLLELGFSEGRIEALFNRPMAIPLPTFHQRFAELEAYQQQLIAGLSLIEEGGDRDLERELEEPWRAPVHAGRFLAWEDGVAYAQRPLLEDPLFTMELPVAYVDLSFRINGNGRVSGVDALRVEPDERRLRRDAVRAVRAIRFRPAIYAGRARTRSTVQLRYLTIPEPD